MPDWYIISLLLILISIIYSNSPNCDFVFDDVSAVKSNKDLKPHTPLHHLFLNDFWGTPMTAERSHKSYRPLCVLTFRLNYLFGELNPSGYHAVNVVLHGIVTCLFWLVMKTILFDRFVSNLSAILFAVHPIHTEAVTGVVGRAELLAAIFFLLAIFTYKKASKLSSKSSMFYLISTVLLACGAMLCKEQGITVIGVCCVYELLIIHNLKLQNIPILVRNIVNKNPPKWIKSALFRIFILLALTVSLMFARLKVMEAKLPFFTNFDNPAAASPSPTRQLTFNYLLAINSWLLFFPSSLCCDWSMDTIPLITSFFDIRNLATLLFYIIFIWLGLLATCQQTKISKEIAISLMLISIPFLPSTNLLFPVGFVVAERVLYIPSMGYCILVVIGFKILYDKMSNSQFAKWFISFGFVFLIISFGCKTYRRNFDWRSEYTLFKSAIQINQRNAKLFNNVGHALESEKEFTKALKYFKYATKIQPDDVGAHNNVGRTLKVLNLTKDAENAYRQAVAFLPKSIKGKTYTTRVTPSHLNALLGLGSLISKDDDRLNEADSLYLRALNMKPSYLEAHLHRGEILMRRGMLDEALEQYKTALKFHPTNVDILFNIGVVLIEKGNKIEALKYFEMALKYDPDHKQSLYNSAIVIQELSIVDMREEGIRRLRRLLDMENDNTKAYFALALLYADVKEYSESVTFYKKCIEFDPSFRSALFNLALLLNNELKKEAESYEYLEKLLHYHPDHVKGLLLMGDLNLNFRHDKDAAEKNYERILQLQPDNIQAMHNLCIVYVEKNDLKRAEKCLTDTLAKAPKLDYIRNHLNIVKARISKGNNKSNKPTN